MLSIALQQHEALNVQLLPGLLHVVLWTQRTGVQTLVIWLLLFPRVIKVLHLGLMISRIYSRELDWETCELALDAVTPSQR